MTLTSLNFRRAPRPFRAWVVPTFNKALIVSGFAIVEKPTGLSVKMPGWAQAEMTRPEKHDLATRILATYAVRQTRRKYKLKEAA